jgi:hypothetical protein
MPTILKQTNQPLSLCSPRQHRPAKTRPANYFERLTMNHAPANYINAGFAYEKGRTTAAALRAMLAHEPEQAEARRLIEQGRAEARLSTPKKR